MGWLYGFGSPKDVKEHVNRMRGGGPEIVRQAATQYGRHLWTVYELKTGERFINLDLIQKSGAEWGYKDMSEDMHPFYFDCPLSLIEAAGPTTIESSNQWREKVRAYHSAKNKPLAVGDRIEVYGKVYSITGKIEKSWEVRSESDGRTYRMSPKHFARAKVIAKENQSEARSTGP